MSKQPERAKELPIIKKLNASTKAFADKYIGDNNNLKKDIENQLNHNPLIQDHIGDTLSDIESVMSFVMSFTLEEGLNKSRHLEQHEQSAIFLLSKCAISAIQFEQERATYYLSQARQIKKVQS